MQAKEIYSSQPLVGTFNIKADLHQKGEKVGADGLEPQAERSSALHECKPTSRDHQHLFQHMPKSVRFACSLLFESLTNDMFIDI